MKRLLVFFLCLTLLASVTACRKEKPDHSGAPADTVTNTPPPALTGQNPDANPTQPTAKPVAPIDISVAVLKGPTAIGMAKLMSDSKNGTAANRYRFTVAGAADEITAALIKGDIQIAAVPCNLAATLYNKSGGKIAVAAINNLGVLYIVENGNTIQTLDDLKGRTVYSTGQGTTPEYTLRYLLTSAGIDPDSDVNIVYLSEASEVAARLAASSEGAVAMLPQPYVTTVMMKNESVRIAIDVTGEWELRNEDSTVVTGVIVVNRDFLEKNRANVDAFLAEFEASASFAQNNVDETATILESFDIFPAAIGRTAIPYCNIRCITGAAMKTAMESYLKVLFDQNPRAVGGKMPEEDFYYSRY